MFCHFCGKQLLDGDRFCQHCGSPVQQMNGGNPQQSYGAGQNVGNQSGTGGSAGYGGAGQGNMGYGNVGYSVPGYHIPEYRNSSYGHPGGMGRAVHQAARTRLIAIGAAALCLIAVMVFVLFFRSDKPEDTVARMEKALNNMDMDALIDCFDEQTQDMYSGALGVGSQLTGADLGAWADLANGFGGFMAGAGLTPEYELEITDIQYEGSDTCAVYVNFYMSYQGEQSTEEIVLPMAKAGRKWAVSAAALQDIL